MKKAVLIFGPHAVGKMTVGQELAKRTSLRLFYNHISIEPFLELFDDMPKERAIATARVRDIVFDLFSKSDKEGIIFTFIWYFDNDGHKREVDEIEKKFQNAGAEVYYVELAADMATRLHRNTTENRLKNKASKRDIAFSENLIETKENAHRLTSHPGEITKKNYIKIDNTHIDPAKVADKIIRCFHL